MKRRTPSLRKRLLYLQIGVFGGVILFAGPILYVVMSLSLVNDRDRYLASMARSLTAEFLATEGAPPPTWLPPRLLPEPVPPDSKAEGATHRPRHFLLCDAEGRVVSSDGETAPLAPAAAVEAARTMTPRYADVRWSAEILRTVAWPFRDGQGEVRVMEIGTSYRVIETALGESIILLGIIEVLALLLLILGSWFLTRRAFQPVEHVIHTLEEIDEKNLAARVPTEDREDELGRFISVTNRMLDRLDQAFQAQRRFSTDVAHEIRSPLTALRGQMEVALRRERTAPEYRQTVEDSLEEVLRLANLAEDLMSLARADAGVLRTRHRTVDLADMLHRVVARFEPAAGENRVEFAQIPSERLFVLGDSGLLSRMVENLVDNAIRHSLPGQAVEITLERVGKAAIITVIDQGEGIAAEHLDRIFDRFYRVDKARSRERGGTGLGLAIVSQFAQFHGGSVTVESEPGKGSRFRIDLPLVSPEDAAEMKEV